VKQTAKNLQSLQHGIKNWYTAQRTNCAHGRSIKNMMQTVGKKWQVQLHICYLTVITSQPPSNAVSNRKMSILGTFRLCKLFQNTITITSQNMQTGNSDNSSPTVSVMNAMEATMKYPTTLLNNWVSTTKFNQIQNLSQLKMLINYGRVEVCQL